LMELENAEAIFVLARMDDDLYLIGRSQTDRLDVAEVLKEWGGGGHRRAASAHVKRLPAPLPDGKEQTSLQAVKTRLLKTLDERIVEEPRAEEIMSRPARTVSAD